MKKQLFASLLAAIMAVVNLNAQTMPVFSVSGTQQVYFAGGNLQYQASTDTWRFAPTQYTYSGKTINEAASGSYDGWIDLFGWGTSGYDDKYPYSKTINNTFYGHGIDSIAGTEYDWGVFNAIQGEEQQAGKWRTLTQKEWDYLLNIRPNHNNLRGQAVIMQENDTTYGYVLLPDGWNASRPAFHAVPNNWTSNQYTVIQWDSLQNAGAVFLPSACSRYGNVVDCEDQFGFYWSSSSYSSVQYAYSFYFNGTDAAIDYNERAMALSVRLAINKEDKPVPTHATYVVNHFKQRLDGSYADTPDETETLTGVANSSITPAVKNYEGFTAPDVETTTIAADSSTVVTYKYMRNSYTLTYEVDGEVYKTYAVAYNQSVTAEPAPMKEGYTFSGWREIPQTMPAHDVEVNGTFSINSYTITFVNWNGEVLSSDEWEYGTTPSYSGTPAKPGDARYSYTFSGWSPEITVVTEAAVYTAQFTESVNTYTVTWQDEDGSVLRTDEVAYGQLPSYGEDPSKAADVQYTYTFAGWTPEISVVKGNQTYMATYTGTLNTYTVVWLDADGTELGREDVAYGETPVYGGETPSKAEDEYYTYEFAGWSPAITAVTGNATYTATYTATAKTPTGIESVIISGNSITGPSGMRIYDYTGKDVTGAKDHLYKGSYIILLNGEPRKVMIP